MSSSEAPVQKQLELPSGYRFLPTDEELLLIFLKNKVLQKPIQDVPITDLDTTELFQQPPKLLECAEEGRQREWFFYICSEGFLLCHDSNAVQKVPNEQGFWKGIDRYPVPDKNEDMIGFRTDAVYFRGKLHCPRKTHWNMEIYQLPDDFYDNLEEKKRTVLVKIRRGKSLED